jgi:hypothetical protein
MSVIRYDLWHLSDAPADDTEQPKRQSNTISRAAQAVLEVYSSPFCTLPRRRAAWRRGSGSTEYTHLCSRPDTGYNYKNLVNWIPMCEMSKLLINLLRNMDESTFEFAVQPDSKGHKFLIDITMIILLTPVV